jgi:hypothetical protein
MSNIQPVHSINQLDSSTPLYSRANRRVARIVANTELAIVSVAGRAAIEAARLEALQAIATQAMTGIAAVGIAESQLSLVAPLAALAGRLQAVGDGHALASLEVVTSAPRRLG